MVENKIPIWAKTNIKDSSLKKIEDAVALAERSTSGEIVPMVVKTCIPVGIRAIFVRLAFTILTLSLLVVDLVFQWNIEAVTLFALGIFLVGTLGGRYLSVRSGVWRILVPNILFDFLVQKRAELEFYKLGLNKTREATGVLIFVSLEDRRAVVLADSSISSLLPPSTWNEVIGTLLKSVSNKHMGQGFKEAIEMTAQLLKDPFPPRDHNPNEQKDALVILE